MLQYKRRNSTKVSASKEINRVTSTPLLTYCNWSYSSDYHIDLNTLKSILNSFNREYIPFYLRIFNETPSRVVEDFLEQYQISKNSLQSIFHSLEADGLKIKDITNIIHRQNKLLIK